MKVPVVAYWAPRKGLEITGPGDILNPKWLRHDRKNTERKDGCPKKDELRILHTTDVEDRSRTSFNHISLFTVNRRCI